jgi:MFS family permease
VLGAENVSSILHNRSLLILGAAGSVSNMGNWITMMAVFALIVFRGDGSVTESSGIFLAGLLPMLLVSPLAGRLADRFDRKWLMIVSELLSGVAVIGLILVRRIELIYALLAVEATFGSLMMPARQAAIVDLVPREELTRANAFLAQLDGTIKIGAPMLAGLILALIGPPSAMILDVISFVLSALILSRLPALPPVAQQVKALPVATTAPVEANTWRALRGSPRLMLLFALAFAVTFILMGFDVLSSIFTRDVLQGSEEFFGVLIGLIGVGTVVVSTGLAFQQGEQKPWRDAIVGLALLAGIPAFLALATLPADLTLAKSLAILGCLIGGLGNGLVIVQSNTLLQLTAPSEWLGRLGGLFQSTFVAGQLMAIFATPILVPAILPIGTYLGIGAVALVLLALGTTMVLQNTRASAAVPVVAE